MIRAGIHLAASEDEKQAVYRFRYDIYVEEMGRYAPWRTTPSGDSSSRTTRPQRLLEKTAPPRELRHLHLRHLDPSQECSHIRNRSDRKSAPLIRLRLRPHTPMRSRNSNRGM